MLKSLKEFEISHMIEQSLGYANSKYESATHLLSIIGWQLVVDALSQIHDKASESRLVSAYDRLVQLSATNIEAVTSRSPGKIMRDIKSFIKEAKDGDRVQNITVDNDPNSEYMMIDLGGSDKQLALVRILDEQKVLRSSRYVEIHIGKKASETPNLGKAAWMDQRFFESGVNTQYRLDVDMVGPVIKSSSYQKQELASGTEWKGQVVYSEISQMTPQQWHNEVLDRLVMC